MFASQAMRNAVLGDIFPLNKLQEIQPMPAVSIFAAVSSVF